MSSRGWTRARSTAGEEQAGHLAPCITLTDDALAHLKQLKEQKKSLLDQGLQLLLRIGVKQGGCSGMSYFMDFETPDKVVGDDAVMDLEGDMKLVCDPKSLLYLFGMELDYSHELIGGGFKFTNPNAESTCGCGKSFSV
ncbi:iron-sulfur cluster assembly protein [Chloropicon primus]|uniref:Iron-sulfur cluster assembly protein n=1 Tax=Chloropicon primus TaxID=1764295 RepID=A0A5B8MR07_9CHLO|nr:iron-sulfur cluster assembly protein [Chloropicon primus]UPR02140.1 iron-sulfur cluster assembly protein [Chloropicon primus]|eukprot:QDZ22916.1 iron-sulfur cluster assembly protein [Chloropicon primus]